MTIGKNTIDFMANMKIAIRKHRIDPQMVEMWTMENERIYLMGVVHEDMFSTLIEYGELDDGEEIVLDVWRQE